MPSSTYRQPNKKLALLSCLLTSFTLAPYGYCIAPSTSSARSASRPTSVTSKSASSKFTNNKFSTNNQSTQRLSSRLQGEGSGSLEASSQSGKQLGLCPLKHTDVQADVSGYIARVRVEQEFTNPFSEPIEAVYTFPLSHTAAVDEMTMQIGSRTIVGKILKRDDAMKAYKDAKREGKSAAKLDEERPNIFTQSVANIPPHSTIKIQITYSDLLAFHSGKYSFTFPMVVGPRYMPGSPIGAQGGGTEPDTSRVPDASLLSPPMSAQHTRAGHDISLKVNLDAGVTFTDMKSELHKVTTDQIAPTKAVVQLQDSDSIPNRDFVLNWTVGGDQVKSGYLTHKDGSTGYFTMMLVPPTKPTQQQINPRELVFIVDRSGSQSGLPLQKARETMLYILDHLNPRDTFQVMSFSNGIELLFAKPQPVSADTIDEAKKYVAGLHADGGTEMMQAVEIANELPAADHRLRVFAIMTDGYIGNDKQVIDFVKTTRSKSRWFSFGTGNSVNRYLIDGIAKHGGGEAEYVLLNSSSENVAKDFHDKLSSPVLTDVAVKFNGLEVADINPKILNDVWAERPLYITGKYTKAGKGSVTLSGIRGGHLYEQKMEVDLPAANASNPSLPSVWARSEVNELMHSSEDQAGQVPPPVQKQVENLGLQYHLLTKFTSFVAVDNSENRLTPGARTIQVPVETPDGVSMREGQNTFKPGNLTPLNLPVEVGRVEGPRDMNVFQVEPTVLDERHFTSGRAERHQKTSPTLPDGAPIPDNDGAPDTVSGPFSSLNFSEGRRRVAVNAAGGATPAVTGYAIGALAAGQSRKQFDALYGKPVPFKSLNQKGAGPTSSHDTYSSVTAPTKAEVQSRLASAQRKRSWQNEAESSSRRPEKSTVIMHGQPIVVISPIDKLNSNKNAGSGSTHQIKKLHEVEANKSKMDSDLQKSMASWKKIQDDSTTLQLKITLKAADPSIVELLKKLHIVVISTSVNAREIVATVPVRRIIELTKLTAVERLSLDQ
ncbi:MAG: VIT and VWA domain-containing protein [Candidatus Obscuribacterales bacterium]